MAERLSRQELYELVWSQPLRTLSTRFSISDVALRKTCVKAMIPTPERGYWARKDAGQKVTQTPLPGRPPGMEDEVLIAGGGKWWYHEDGKDKLHTPVPPPPQFPEPIEAVRERISRMLGKVTVHKTVSSWHPLIATLLAEDEKRREEQRTSPYPSIWNQPRFETPLERRRMRILNALFLSVAKMNGSASQRQEKEGQFYVSFYHQNVSVALVPSKQPRRRSQPGHEDGDRPESGLTLSILDSSRSESARLIWQDSEASKIEDQITDIAIETVLAAEMQYRDGAVRHHHWKLDLRARMEADERKRQMEAEQAERERLRKIEQAKIDGLLRDAAAFQQADQIRRYVEAIRARMLSADLLPNEDFCRWSDWALANADRIDPSVGEAYLAGMRAAVGETGEEKGR